MATVSTKGLSSGRTKAFSPAASTSRSLKTREAPLAGGSSARPDDSVDRASGTSTGSTRRRGGERRRSSASASGAPPPPGSPPPCLARRASQRDTEPARRRAPSVHGDDGNVAHGAGRHKYDEDGRASGPARTRYSSSAKGRLSYLVPPPADSPPFVASPSEGGVIKRRRNSKAAAGRPRGGRRDSVGLVNSRQQPGRSSESDSDSDRSRSSNSSNSSRFRISEVRNRHYVSDSSCSTRSGQDGKTYLAVDDLMSGENGSERKIGSGRGSEHSSISGKYPCKSRDEKQRSFGRKQVDGHDKKSSRDRAEAYPLKNEHRRHRPSSSRPRSHHNKERPRSDYWTEQNAARAPASANDESNDDGDGSCFHHSNNGRSTKNIEKARGSETTATPSPREHPSIYGGSVVGEPLVDGVNEGVMGWLAEPVTESARVRRHPSGPSAATTASPRQDSTRLSLNTLGNAHDNDHGPETYESATDSTPRRVGDGGNGEDRPRSRRTSSTKNRPSGDHSGRGGSNVKNKIDPPGSSAEKRPSSGRSPGRGKPTRSSDRSSGGKIRRDAKRSHRHRSSPTRDRGSRDDTVGVGGSSLTRMENPSAGVTASEKGGREPARGRGSWKEPKAGGWFAAQGEEERLDGESKIPSDAEDIDDADDADDASKDSCTDTKRRYDGKDGNLLLQTGSSDEEQGEDKGEGNDHGEVGGRCWGELYGKMPARCNSLMLSYERGNTSDLVQCIIVRDRSGMNRLYPQYRFFFESRREQLMMIAQKCSKNRTSNYHVFDMKRGGFRARLSKKNGNYLGKVRTNLKRTEVTVFTNDQEVAELGAISFEKPGLVDHLRDGSQPRKFSVLLPALDCDGAPVAHKVDPYDADSDMLSCIKQGRYGNMFLLQSREPTYTKGNYRLNFHGRVTVPSVKNFQLVSPDDKLHTVCQFGKVGEDRFHLDYRAPINAFQAFCISLAQFNF